MTKMQVLMLVFFTINLVESQFTYYIVTPHQNVSCPLHYDNCTTLSTFAATFNAPKISNSNTSLTFHPGNHTLDMNISIINVFSFMMSSSHHHMNIRTNIRCDTSVSMLFFSVTNVHISNLDFTNCFDLTINSVNNFSMDNITDQGIWKVKGSALIANNSNVILFRSTFKGFSGSLWSSKVVQKRVNMNKTLVGGVMIILNSRVEILDCKFQNNTASLGGALYIERFSNVTIRSSTLIDHFRICHETCRGGVIFVDSSTLLSFNSSFVNNVLSQGVPKNVPKGGVIQSFESQIVINSSNFSMNFAYMGAVIESRGSIIEFYSTNFSRNTAKLNGGVGLFKTSTAIIRQSNFDSNIATDKAGGVFYLDRSKMTITDSRFNSNQALNLGGVARISKSTISISHTSFIANKVYSRGGVIYFSLRNDILLTSCKFYNNNAYAGGAISLNTGGRLRLEGSNLFVNNSAFYGGAIQVQFSSLTCTKSKLFFLRNSASWGVFNFLHSSGNISGKLSFNGNTGSLLAFDSDIYVCGNINFQNNTPEGGTVKQPGVREGGGITSILSNIDLKGNVKFKFNQAFNGGGIMATSSRVEVSDRIEVSQNYASDTGGGMYLYHSKVIVNRGSLSILGNEAVNKGGAIHFVGSSLITVMRSRTQSFAHLFSNKAKFGGGICMESSSKLYTTTHVPVLHFFNNTADYGGAIYVSDETNNGTCTSSQQTITSTSDSDCFLQSVLYNNAYNTPYEKSKVIENLIQFSENSAKISGAVLYGGLLDRCTIDLFDKRSYIKVQYSIQPNFIYSILNYTSSSAVRLCFCEEINSDVDCSYQPEPVKALKGRNFTLYVTAVDHVNHTINHSIVHSFLSHRDSQLGKGLKTQKTDSFKCTALNFRVYTPLEREDIMIMYPEGPCKDAEESRREVKIIFLSCQCPIGFEPSKAIKHQHTCKCVCHSQILNVVSSCDDSTSIIHRKNNVWIKALNSSSFIIFPHCPFDYCLPSTVDVSINFTNENGVDAQCNHNRSGTLCSVCRPNLTLSLGSSRCLYCPKYWPALIVVITVGAFSAGIILCAIILILNLTVAVGTMNGIVFYANVVASNKSIFLPFQKINGLTVILAWLNLDFGLDTCYYKGMDTYSKTWFEFIFSFYIITLVVIVILICKYSDRFSSYIGKRNPVATLATLILFSYAKLLQTIITVVSFGVLRYPDGTHELVWRPDATVKYLSGKHIPLFIVALLVFSIGISYTSLLFSWQWLLPISNSKLFRWVQNTKISSFMDAYHAPYTPRKRYWTGLLLIARVILYVISAINVYGDPSINLLAVIVVVTTLFIFKFNIYKKWTIDFLETGLYVNLIMFSAGKFYIMEHEGGSHILLASVSGCITIFMLLCVLIYHIFTNTSIKNCVNGMQKIIPSPLIEGNLTSPLIKNEGESSTRDSAYPKVTFSLVEFPKPTLSQTCKEKKP